MERKGEYRGQKREIRSTAMMEREEERRNKERNEKKKGIWCFNQLESYMSNTIHESQMSHMTS